MPSLKETLGREEERLNLKNGSICILLVIALVTVVFGFTYMKPLFQGERTTPGENR